MASRVKGSTSLVGGRRQQAADRAFRPAMRSPGRPEPSRAVERRFWRLIAQGVMSEDASAAVGVSPPVGSRWFRHAGGMPPITLAEPSGRYLSFEEPEEIALLKACAHGVREIARRLGRDPSRISRELRRNAATGLGSGSTGLAWPSGRRNTLRSVPSQPSWRRTRGCVPMSRNASPGWSPTRKGGRSRGRMCRGRGVGMAAGRNGGGGWRGVRSRSATGWWSSSPMMSR